MTLDDIVQEYVRKHRRKKERELRYFRIQRTLRDAVQLAGLAQTPGRKGFPHQRRLRQAVLDEASHRLLALVEDIEGCQSFDELLGLVAKQIGTIHGVGALMIYDTALRIGAGLGVEPDFVYLHAGTRGGAHALGLNVNNRSFLSLEELPTEFEPLQPLEIEDCLCIFKDEIRATRN